MDDIIIFTSVFMTGKELEQIKSYSILLVHELHKIVMDEKVFDRMNRVLRLAEELELYVWQTEKKLICKPQGKSNVIPFKRLA